MLRILLLCGLTAAAQVPLPMPGRRPPVIVYPPTTPTGRIPRQPRPAPSSIPATISAPVRGANHGILRERKPKQITIETDDHRVIWYRLADNLQVDKNAQPANIDEFSLGDRLLVDHAEDDLGQYTAMTVHWVSAATVESTEAAVKRWDLPTKAPVEVNERPRLRRGPPPPKIPEQAPEEPVTRAERTLPEAPPATVDPLIQRAREAAEEFGTSLPSFEVRQLTTRYLREFARGEWEALDMVTANLRYRDGVESYTDIKVGGKTVKEAMDDIDGARSTGEFYTLLREILDPASAGVYSRMGRDRIAGRDAWKFRYEIGRERSRFRIVTPSQLYYSAHRGTLWIDAETYRVLRLEQEAADLPNGFPFDTAEVTVDYETVRLEKPFLLPVSAEMLYCVRLTTACFRNHTDFRNYVKFESESGIVFSDPN